MVALVVLGACLCQRCRDHSLRELRLCGLNLRSIMQLALDGDLDRVEGVLKVFGMVNAVPDFIEHPKVIDGCTDLFVDVFDDAGRPARSAVGMGSLPRSITVEIEAIVLIKR